MAGKRHHIIPKFLQKGFASRSERKAVWTWHYRKGAFEPQEIGTRDSIVAEHFYGKDELNADPEITEFENTVVPLVEGLRNGSVDPSRCGTNVALLIAHFCIRTKGLRSTFESMSGRFMAGMGEIFRDENLLWDVIRSQPDSFFLEQFHEAFSNPAYPTNDLLNALEGEGVTREVLNSTLLDLIRGRLNDDESCTVMREGISDIMANLPSPMFSIISESIKEGHIKALKENVAPDVWVTTFEKLTWSIQTCKFEVILGDSGTMFRSIKTDSWMSLCEPDDIKMVILPISRYKVLIGRTPSQPETVIGEEINAAIATCSCEQFISAIKSEKNRRLIELIGSSPDFFTDELIESELDDIRNNLRNDLSL